MIKYLLLICYYLIIVNLIYLILIDNDLLLLTSKQYKYCLINDSKKE